jgi:SOS response regulatory protein OraA/RecX
MAARILRRSVTEAGNVRLSVTVEQFEGEVRRTFTVSAEDDRRLGSPAQSEEIDDELISSLAEAEGRLRATEKAVSLLSYGDNSPRALCNKLRARGYDRESAEAAVATMIGRGYIREEEQALRLAVACATKKLWGRRKILSYLASRGYDAAIARCAIETAVAEGEIDFDGIKRELIEKKLDEDASYDEKRKLLYRYGH